MGFRLSNPERLIVIGTSLSAGFGDFSMHRESQRWSYPAQLAKQMGLSFTQPLLQPPGIGEALGFECQPVVIPHVQQSTVFDTIPPPEFDNISIPGYTLRDALDRYPQEPIVWRNDAVQTACNLLLGGRDLPLGKQPRISAVKYAARRSASLAIIELGFTEAARAAVAGNVGLMPDKEAFGGSMRRVFSEFSNSSKIVLTVPDPFDTAHFFTIYSAAEALRVEPEFLRQSYGVGEDDFIGLPGVHEIAFDIFARRLRQLRGDYVIRPAAAGAIRTRIGHWNRALEQLAQESGSLVFDLYKFQRSMAERGELVGSRFLKGAWLSGYYRLNGWYPGHTGHGRIANGILEIIQIAVGRRFDPIDLVTVAEKDPACACTPAAGRRWSQEQLRQRWRTASSPSASQVFSGRQPAALRELPDPGTGLEPLATPLRISPGYVQVSRINPDASYFGDGISASLCSEPIDIEWGSAANHLFGGFAMVDSHLSGELRFEFGAPKDGAVTFQLSFVNPLEGEDSELSCPVFFHMPFHNNRVGNVQGKVSSGEVDLKTGVVSKLRIYSQFISDALNLLVGVNPSFPKDPLCFVTTDIARPLEYGSAWAKFTQRPDGELDFVFYGTRFVPLRAGIKWPLNFSGPERRFALVPADGTAMHPHLRLSTREDSPGTSSFPPFQPNTVQELTFHTHNTAFGDAYSLDVPEIGGPAKGRTHLLGRALLQFGTPSRNTIPVAITNLAPGGLFAAVHPSRISTDMFPKHLTPGPTGFNEFLRFPLRTYSLDELAMIDDPFDVVVGAADLSTGMLFPEHLHRGFIEQDLIYAILRLEPGTPKSSFYFRGPAVVETNRSGALVFRYRATVHVPYPKSFKFPEPNLDRAYVVRSESALDPFFWIHAELDGAPANASVTHQTTNMLSSAGELFSCGLYLSADPNDKARFFWYKNHAQDGTFHLLGLSWITFGSSTGSEIDTVSFSGFGTWQMGPSRTLRQVAAQICKNPKTEYFGIQIDTGDVSNVNNKPADEREALP